MSTILIYTSPARGHLYPMMDVAVALRSAGHRVVLQTLADDHDRVVTQGLEHRAIAAPIEAIELKDYEAANPAAQIRAALDAWPVRAPHEVDDLRAASIELEPNLLVVDANTWGAAAFAEAQGRRWAMFLPYALPVASPDASAFGPGFAPPRHVFDRISDRAVWGVVEVATRR